MKEKAKFSLEISIRKLDQRIEALKGRVASAVAELKAALEIKDRNLAQTHLMRKKQIEAQAQKLYSQRYTVEQQLMNLEATEDDAAVLETLSVATSANKNYMADSDTIESTLSDIAEQQEQMDKISKMFEI